MSSSTTARPAAGPFLSFSSHHKMQTTSADDQHCNVGTNVPIHSSSEYECEDGCRKGQGFQKNIRRDQLSCPSDSESIEEHDPDVLCGDNFNSYFADRTDSKGRGIQDCTICKENSARWISKPCGHLLYCDVCYPLREGSTCPLCRQNISRYTCKRMWVAGTVQEALDKGAWPRGSAQRLCLQRK